MVFDKRWFIPSTGERKRQGACMYSGGEVIHATGAPFGVASAMLWRSPCASIVEHRTLIMAPFSETIKKVAEREGLSGTSPKQGA